MKINSKNKIILIFAIILLIISIIILGIFLFQEGNYASKSEKIKLNIPEEETTNSIDSEYEEETLIEENQSADDSSADSDENTITSSNNSSNNNSDTSKSSSSNDKTNSNNANSNNATNNSTSSSSSSSANSNTSSTETSSGDSSSTEQSSPSPDYTIICTSNSRKTVIGDLNGTKTSRYATITVNGLFSGTADTLLTASITHTINFSTDTTEDAILAYLKTITFTINTAPYSASYPYTLMDSVKYNVDGTTGNITATGSIESYSVFELPLEENMSSEDFITEFESVNYTCT